ncbi:MAG: SLC13 family permease, partial [Alphaproteobacteria bacterium]
MDSFPAASSCRSSAESRAFARGVAARIGLVAGVAAFVLVMALPPPQGMPEHAWRVSAVAALMAVWWMTEAAPIAATALVPLAAFPLLGIAPIDKVAPHFANPILFLFLGGFVIASAMEKWGLSRRIALRVLAAAGARPDV